MATCSALIGRNIELIRSGKDPSLGDRSDAG
jgi:hypothetical protein